MGLELIFGAISGIVSLVTGFAQAGAMQQQANAMRQSADAQREANRVEAAQTEANSAGSRRQKIREMRIRRAQALAFSENQGTGASSGELGMTSALSSNLAGMQSTSLGNSKANAGINANMQRAADFSAQADQFGAQANVIGAWGNAFQSGLSGFSSIFAKK